MTEKLKKSERERIIFNHIKGIEDPLYEVSQTKYEKYIDHLGITNKFLPYSELEAGNVVSITGMTYAPPNSVTVSSTDYPIPAQVGVVINKIPPNTAGLTTTPTITECKSHLACFGLDINIYNQLAARYEQMALSFPIQTLTFHQMNCRIDHSKLSGNSGQASVSSTAVPRFVDSIFFLFPLDANHRTCDDKILASEYSLKMGGYGTFPEITYSTHSPEFLEVSANVFNVNNDLTGFNKDVVRLLNNPAASETGFTSYESAEEYKESCDIKTHTICASNYAVIENIESYIDNKNVFLVIVYD